MARAPMNPPPPPWWAAARMLGVEPVLTIPTLISDTLGNHVLAGICESTCERGCEEMCHAQWNHWTGEMDSAL